MIFFCLQVNKISNKLRCFLGVDFANTAMLALCLCCMRWCFMCRYGARRLAVPVLNDERRYLS